MTRSTEAASPRSRGLDTWDDADILAALWESQAAAAAAVRVALPAIAAAADDARTRLAVPDDPAAGHGRLVYAGAGSSGRVAFQDGVELGPTFGWPAARLILLLAGGDGALLQAAEGAEDDTQAATDAVAAHAIGADDVVIGVAASARTPYTVALVQQARARGALTIAVANMPGPLLEGAAHPILADTGSEVVAGSTRLAAATAQKIVLNLFSTLLMTRLGRVHDGRMVAMRATNAKLRGRAAAMVGDLAGCGSAAATAALAAAGDDIKLAVLIGRGHAPHHARALLARHGHSLRAALQEPAP